MIPARVRVIVPSERHVERLSRGAHARGEAVETRSALRARLLAALAPSVVLATSTEVRVALAEVMPEVASDDALLAPIARDAGAAWLRTVDAVDVALGALRAAAVDEATLAMQAPRAIAGRVRMLEHAMRALDALLARGDRVDGRRAGTLLARAIADCDPERVRDVLGAERAVATWILTWDAADVAWWRALDVALRRAGGGGAVIELPAIDRPFDTERERAPLEIVADELARSLDEAPQLAPTEAPLGDLSLAGSLEAARAAVVEVRHASDARAQARAAADAVRSALAAGVAVESIVIALPIRDDETLAPLRAMLDDAGIVAHTPRTGALSRAGLVTCALDALSIAERGLERRAVATLLRSRYVDVVGLARAGAVTSSDLADVLEETPSAPGADAVAQLEATARAGCRGRNVPHRESFATLARAVGAALVVAHVPRTRAEHASTARAIWQRVGLAARSDGDVARSLADDAPATGLARAALHAASIDARAWAALDDALTSVEAAAAALGIASRVVSAEAFRHEIVRTLDAGGAPPAAGRAGAVRVLPIVEIAGEPLELLVVLDANDGVLPSNGEADPIVTDAFGAWLRDRGRNAPASAQLRRARELAALAAAATGARTIVFTSRERDDSGGLLAPAAVIAWLARCGVASTRWSASPLAGTSLNAREATLRALAGGVDTAPAAAVAPEAARRARIERERESLFESASPARTELRGALTPDAAREAILVAETGGGDRAMSVTALERIASCPFQGFASQLLRARDDAPIGETPDAREAGNLVHGALAAAFDATAELWRVRPRDAGAITSRARIAAAAHLERTPASSSLRRIEIERLLADVDAVVAWSIADDAWDFAHAEVSFGDPRAAWPALELTDGVVRIALRGTIDRVDVGHDGSSVRAIDYKTGTTAAADAGKRLGDTTFQVALYARAAAAHHGATSADGLYLPARARTLATFKRPRAHDEAWASAHADDGGRPAIEARALAVVASLRHGSLMPDPRPESACTHCRYDGGCRKPRFAIRADDAVDGDGEGDV